mmetsp:Transcript_1954/g.7672  ORF Transcript_1954/g.7672 Transcript_1954/m.7672 type:complete len:570 (-) Transcript_1954:80-1789(-)
MRFTQAWRGASLGGRGHGHLDPVEGEGGGHAVVGDVGEVGGPREDGLLHVRGAADCERRGRAVVGHAEAGDLGVDCAERHSLGLGEVSTRRDSARDGVAAGERVELVVVVAEQVAEGGGVRDVGGVAPEDVGAGCLGVDVVVAVASGGLGVAADVVDGWEVGDVVAGPVALLLEHRGDVGGLGEAWHELHGPEEVLGQGGVAGDEELVVGHDPLVVVGAALVRLHDADVLGAGRGPLHANSGPLPGEHGARGEVVVVEALVEDAVGRLEDHEARLVAAADCVVVLAHEEARGGAEAHHACGSVRQVEHVVGAEHGVVGAPGGLPQDEVLRAGGDAHEAAAVGQLHLLGDGVKAERRSGRRGVGLAGELLDGLDGAGVQDDLAAADAVQVLQVPHGVEHVDLAAGQCLGGGGDGRVALHKALELGRDVAEAADKVRGCIDRGDGLGDCNLIRVDHLGVDECLERRAGALALAVLVRLVVPPVLEHAVLQEVAVHAAGSERLILGARAGCRRALACGHPQLAPSILFDFLDVLAGGEGVRGAEIAPPSVQGTNHASRNLGRSRRRRCAGQG